MDLNWILLTKALTEAGLQLAKKDVEALWSALGVLGITMAMAGALAESPRPVPLASEPKRLARITVDLAADGSISFGVRAA